MAATRLDQLAEVIRSQGIPVEVSGAGDEVVQAVNTLEDAAAGEISFLSNPKYRAAAEDSRASALIVGEGVELESSVPKLVCKDPYAAMMISVVHLHGYRKHPQWGVSQDASISSSAVIGEGACIGPYVTIAEDVKIGRRAVIYPGTYIAKGVEIGDEVLLYPNVTIYEGCRLGDRVTLHAGTVIGEDGLGYAPVGEKWVKIPQVGVTILGDDVEIGANCAIDRATIGYTSIGSGTKFSNCVVIGHGSKVGEDCMIVAQVGVAGSTTVGRHVTIAGQAGLVGHIKIEDNATIGAQAGVVDNVPEGATVLGSPAVPIADARRQMIVAQRLPEMNKRLKQLEGEVERLRKLLEKQDQG